MRYFCICVLLFINLAANAQAPEPVAPVYTKLKQLHLDTPLDSLTIVAGEAGLASAATIQAALLKKTGKQPRIIHDGDIKSFPIQQHLILIGNRSSNKVISGLYDRGFTFLDLKYPGAGGYVVNTLHNPFGNGNNVIFAGGSDEAGTKAAADLLVALIDKSKQKKVGHLSQIKLGKGYTVPADIMEAGIWEASERYGSTGYFGWNIVSKNMALFYMTGDKKYADEFVRLAFPDARAMQLIDSLDGERIENKKDPLAGPYHYSAHNMVVLWDLIEEHPYFSDSLRLKITNALARQLPHRVIEGVYLAEKAPGFLGDRHGDWSAFSLYALGRYFQRDYPSPVWAHSMAAADRFFATLRNTYWMGGMNDHLFWFTSFYDPLLNYLLFTGLREPVMLNNLRKGLNTQHITATGREEDWGTYSSSISMLNKAAYILQEGDWLYYRQQLNLDTNQFRLGQSYWPDASLKATAPQLNGRWNIQQMPEGMYNARKTGFTPQESFRWGSYRSENGAGGDYALIKGYNGAGRNPYHTYVILELRINGTTVLEGYHNQVQTSAAGMIEPKVAMDAALKYKGVLGRSAAAVGEVPDLPYTNWKRSLAIEQERYALIVDELDFRKDNQQFKIETTWQTARPEWIHSTGGDLSLKGNRHLQVWQGNVKKGERKVNFHLIGKGLKCAQIAPNAALLQLPEKALAVTGGYSNITGRLVILSTKKLFGHGLQKAGNIFAAGHPLDAGWEFENGVLTLDVQTETVLNLKLVKKDIKIDGKAVSVTVKNGWSEVRLLPGRHVISEAFPAPVQWPAYKLMPVQPAVIKNAAATALKILPAMEVRLGDSAVATITIPPAMGQPALLASASGKTISIFSADGKLVRKLATDAKVMVMHYWPEQQMLLAGCEDDQLIAFDGNGNRKWAYTTVMNHEVYEAGKQYWFKKVYPGVYGVYAGIFDGGQPRIFAGSACTVEVLDIQGKLVKSIPVFWGNVRQFMLVKAQDGSPDLLAGRWMTDIVNFAVISSKTLKVDRFGYDNVPQGHTYVKGWMNMSRYDNYLTDLNNDGKREIVSAINGAFNRISIYSESGNPVDNLSFGAGKTEPRSNITMMEVADISGDGQAEIIAGLSSGLLNAYNGNTRELQWSEQLPSAPVAIKAIRDSKVLVGMEDGTILVMNGKGAIQRQGKVDGRPLDIQLLETPKGQMAVVTTASGNITGFTVSTL